MASGGAAGGEPQGAGWGALAQCLGQLVRWRVFVAASLTLPVHAPASPPPRSIYFNPQGGKPGIKGKRVAVGGRGAG